MKHLLNTLFVLEPEAYLSLDNHNVVIKGKDGKITNFPLHILESIFCFNYYGASPALMGACASSNIGLTFNTPNGKFLARVSSSVNGNVLLRMSQYRYCEDLSKSVSYARNFIIGKIYNAKWVLERYKRDHSLLIDAESISRISAYLSETIAKVRLCEDLDNLRGFEGDAAVKYFSVFDNLILKQKDYFKFEGRTKRPPLDPVNALLSFSYTLMSRDCEMALSNVGLDPYVGFMHRPKPGRRSMALDLMEELRSVFCDKFVLSLINNRIVKNTDFARFENNAFLLNDEGRRKVLSAWQQRKKDVLLHPYLKEKINWGLVPYVQALLLARAIRGDINEYPPFLWK